MNDERLCAAVITMAVGRTSTVAVVSDRRLSVAALAALLLTDPRRCVVVAARGADDVRAALEVHRPDVIVADGIWSQWPGAIDAAQWDGRLLALLDIQDDAATFLSAVEARVQGYLSRSASATALEAAIEAVRTSGYYLDPLLAGKILWASEQARLVPLPTPHRELSSREREILTKIASGRSSKQIAREYAITAKTVCNHVSNIYAKLQVRHRGELVLYAAAHGLTVA